MIMRQLDGDGDWTFGKGIANYVQNEAAIRLNVATALRCWVGDCFFALQFGVDYKRFLDVGQQKNLATAVQSVIQACYGIVSVSAISADFDPKTRRIVITYSATDIFNNSFQAQVNALAGTGN